jgi:hypothetical protein
MEQPNSYWMDFHELLYLWISTKICQCILIWVEIRYKKQIFHKFLHIFVLLVYVNCDCVLCEVWAMPEETFNSLEVTPEIDWYVSVAIQFMIYT